MGYEPFGQMYSAQMTRLVRSNAHPRQLMEPIRREIQSGNPDLAAITLRTLEDQFEESAAPSRQKAVVLMALCTILLTLRAFGLFGVISYAVRQRVRDAWHSNGRRRKSWPHREDGPGTGISNRGNGLYRRSDWGAWCRTVNGRYAFRNQHG